MCSADYKNLGEVIDEERVELALFAKENGQWRDRIKSDGEMIIRGSPKRNKMSSSELKSFKEKVFTISLRSDHVYNEGYINLGKESLKLLGQHNQSIKVRFVNNSDYIVSRVGVFYFFFLISF